MVVVGRLPVGHNLADDSLHLECLLLLLGPLVAHVGAQLVPALPVSDSRAAPNAAAVDAGIAVLEVVCVLVALEEQRLQLQHVRCALWQGERKASLAHELVFLELVPQVLHSHQFEVGVVLCKRQR
eukprot:6213025-Pleurochrysis_carterae.AAC.1